LAPATTTVAQPKPAPRGIPPQVFLPGEETTIRADSLTEDAERKVVVGEGFVDVRFLGNRLQADRVEINTETGDGVASGNVVFQDKGNRLVCNRIEFNIRRHQAVLYGARGELGREYKVSGERIERQDQDHYRIQDGSISTCKGPVPEWQFRSRSMDITLEEFAFIRQPTFWVAGFPVGYLPYMIAPIKTKRSSGFLVPIIGTSSRDGFKYDQEFFWAFSDHADATFGLEYRKKRGFIPRAELRYRLSGTTRGTADVKFLDDDLSKETFYRIRAEHYQEFGDKFTGFYQVERVNNLDFDSTFEEDLGVRTRRDVESRVNLQKNWDIASTRFFLQFLDSAEESRDEFFQRAPDINFNLSPSIGRVGPITISPSVQTSLVRFNRRQDREDEFWRLDAAPRLSVPFSGLKWATFSPFMEGRVTYYTDGREAGNRSRKSGSFSRELWAAGVNAGGPKLFRTFPLGFQRLPAVKHLTQLNVSYFYRPDMDENDRGKIVQIDSTDSFGPRNSLSYAWEHRLLAKVQSGRDVFESRDVLNLTVSHSLDVDKLQEGEDRPLSEVAFRLESKPFRLWRIGFDTSYNIYDGEFPSYGVSLDLREGRDWFLRHEVRFRDQKGEGNQDELTNVLSAGFRVWKVFFLEGGARWTGEDPELLEKNILFRFQGCCWGFTLEFVGRDDETLFQFGFNLVGLIGDDDSPVFKFGRSVATPE
jgi:LPS-assembly protein